MKCRMKSKCLSNLQVQECERIIAHDNTPEVTVDQDETAWIHDDIFVKVIMSSGEVFTNKLLEELGGV